MMHPVKFRNIPGALFATLLCLASLPALASPPTTPYAQLPMTFEANRGQADPRVHFLSRGSGYSLFLTGSEAVLSLNKPSAPTSKTDIVRMSLPGSNSSARVTGDDRLPGTASYFIGSDPASWHTAAPTFASVRYDQVYPGVDLVFYGNQSRLEYDFIVAPNADPRPIRLRFTGARRLKLNPGGDLEVIASNGVITLQKPVLYQQIEGSRKPIQGTFVLLPHNQVAFRPGPYDRTRQLVIDPILAYSTYLGGSGYHVPAGGDCCGDYGTGIAVDAAGSTYITGVTGSADFPITTGAIQNFNGAAHSPGIAFVTRLNAAGTAPIYSTYLGGTGDYFFKDAAHAIAIDAFGDAYVTGSTGSKDFPTTVGAYQRTNKSFANGARTAFVSKLSPDGTVLLFSTYLGGSGYNTGVSLEGDSAAGIALDATGNAFIAGSTYSRDFPVTPGALQSTNKAAAIIGSNGFLAKLTADGSKLLFATYLGGSGVATRDFSGADYATAVAVDTAGSPYVTGYAHSKNFPVTPNAFQSTNQAKNSINAAGASDTNAFVTRFSPDGASLVYSTYLGGTGNQYYGDQGAAIAVDADGNAYVGGSAGSLDFPTTHGAFQPRYIEDGYVFSGFIAKVNNAGSALFYSSYLSGSGQFGVGKRGEGDSIDGVALDPDGHAFLTGRTYAADFPVTPDAFQLHNNQSSFPSADYYAGNAFLSEVSLNGASLLYSTYLGGAGATDGSGGDTGSAIAVDPSGNAYITGSTISANFPTTPGVFQASSAAHAAGHPDSMNSFISKIGSPTIYSLIPTTTSVTSDAPIQAPGVKVTFTAHVDAFPGIGLAQGTVGFSIDGSPTVFVLLDDTQHASFALSTLTPGRHILTATFYGDVFYSSSSGTAIETTSTGTPQTIAFPALPTTAIYGSAGPYLLNATATSGLPVTYTLSGPATLAGSLLTITGAGTVSVTASQPGNGSYSAAAPITQTIVVSPGIIPGTVQLITTETLIAQPDGSYLVSIKVTNTGTGTAQSVLLTGVSIGSAVASSLPPTLGDIAPGASVLTSVALPASTGASGSHVLEKITGTFTGGSFGGSYRVTLP